KINGIQIIYHIRYNNAQCIIKVLFALFNCSLTVRFFAKQPAYKKKNGIRNDLKASINSEFIVSGTCPSTTRVILTALAKSIQEILSFVLIYNRLILLFKN